jgi:adenosine deaminase
MYSIINSLPKAEHHIHLVGSIRPETLLWVADESGLGSQWDSVEEVRAFFKFNDFPHFLKVFGTCMAYITKESMFERIAYETLEDQASQNVLHSEIIFSAPQRMKNADMSFALMMDALNKGVEKAQREYGVTCSTRVDLIRDYGPDYQMEVLDEIQEHPKGVVGIEIGGGEHAYPPAQFKPVYERARGMGMRLVAHAGEALGWESVVDAVEYLGVERIGHGLTAQQNPDAVALLKERGVTLETCPVSNIRTGVCKDIKDHPVRKYYDQGVSISVNSDDPTMFGTDMNNEYMTLHEAHSFTVAELFDISLNSIRTSFLPEKKKVEQLTEFQSRYDKIVELLE